MQQKQAQRSIPDVERVQGSIPDVDYSRKWYVMIAVSLGVLVATIDGSIVNVALPTLVRAFGTQFNVVEWVVLVYLLTLTTLLLSVGRLADMIGKKSLYAAGFVIFTAGSVLAGLSPTIYWLIGFRVLQGVGAAMLAALGPAIVTEAFPPTERGKALGITGAMVSVGIVIGPTLGGYLIDTLSWHWIFFVNLPIGILGTLIALRYVQDLKPAERQRFDYAGAATLFVFLLALLLGLTLGQQFGFDAPAILALFVVSALTLIAFVGIEWRVDQPMIELRLFRDSLLSSNLLTGFISFIAIAGTLILMPFYLENILGYSPGQVGLLLAVVPVGLGVMAPIAGALSDRVGTRPITVLGLAMLVGGYYLVSTLGAHTTAMGYIVRFLPIGMGMGIFQSPNNSAIMGSVPRSRLGIGGGLLAITRTLGQIVGIGLLGAVWAGRVAFYAGGSLPGGAAAAPVNAQLAGLQDTFLAVVFLITLALLLSVWGLVRERYGGHAAAGLADYFRQAVRWLPQRHSDCEGCPADS
jgi:EmrB/QacA subfamily drug resistance transporter